jgi:hypothetical protein
MSEEMPYKCMVADLRIYDLSSFRFVTAKRRQNDNYRIFAPKRRQIDKTTKKRRQTQPLISDLICRLFAWRCVVLSPRKDDRTTKRQNDNCRLFAPKRRQNKKMTKRQNDICRRFSVLSSFRDDKTPSEKTTN